MSITVEVNGREYEGFISLDVGISLNKISGSFSAVLAKFSEQIEKFEAGQTCVVRVEGETVITGFLDATHTKYDIKSDTTEISGRDRTMDVIDSSVPEKNEFSGVLSLESIIRQTLVNAEIAGIEVINTVSGLTSFTASEINSGATGQSIFDFLERLAQKKQVFLTTDGLGNIVISQSTGELVSEALINEPGNPGSNILSASMIKDDSNRYHQYSVKAQANHAAQGGFAGLLSEGSETVDEDKDGIFTDPTIRKSRKIVIFTGNDYTNEQTELRAKWEANMRTIKSRTLTYVVAGHKRSINSGIWRPNQLVPVKDTNPQININEELLIDSVQFSQTKESGARTHLSLIHRDAYKTTVPIADDADSGLGGFAGLLAS